MLLTTLVLLINVLHNFFFENFQPGQPYYLPHPAKIDLNKKWLPKQNTVQNFNIDAQGFRKTRNENPPTREIGVTS